MRLFRITSSRGFHIRFDNGVCVSCQFGGGNYADNYDMAIGSEPQHSVLESTRAELAVWIRQQGKGSRWITHEYPGNVKGDDVWGYTSPNDLLGLLNWAAIYKKAVDVIDEAAATPID